MSFPDDSVGMENLFHLDEWWLLLYLWLFLPFYALYFTHVLVVFFLISCDIFSSHAIFKIHLKSLLFICYLSSINKY